MGRTGFESCAGAGPKVLLNLKGETQMHTRVLLCNVSDLASGVQCC